MLDTIRAEPRTLGWLQTSFNLSEAAVGRWSRNMRKAQLVHIGSLAIDSRGRLMSHVLHYGPGEDAKYQGPRRTPAERMAAARALKKGTVK